MGYTPPRIALYDTTTQNIAVINTAQVVTFNTLDGTAVKITQTSSSRFTIKEPGRYAIVGKAQINLTGGTAKFIELWIRKNGVDVALSDGRWGLATASSDASVPILGYVDCVTGDYLELWMTGNDTALQITTVAAGGGAPQTHSVNMVISKTS